MRVLLARARRRVDHQQAERADRERQRHQHDIEMAQRVRVGHAAARYGAVIGHQSCPRSIALTGGGGQAVHRLDDAPHDRRRGLGAVTAFLDDGERRRTWACPRARTRRRSTSHPCPATCAVPVFPAIGMSLSGNPTNASYAVPFLSATAPLNPWSIWARTVGIDRDLAGRHSARSGAPRSGRRPSPGARDAASNASRRSRTSRTHWRVAAASTSVSPWPIATLMLSPGNQRLVRALVRL